MGANVIADRCSLEWEVRPISKNDGDFIVLIGSIEGTLGGSEYLKTIHNQINGPITHIDLEFEYAVQKVCLESIKNGIIHSAHDISDGGLAVSIVESFIYSKENLGVKLDLKRKSRNDELLFGEFLPNLSILSIVLIVLFLIG